MVRVWYVDPCGENDVRTFSMDSSVKDILDSFATDADKRSNSYLMFLDKTLEEDLKLSDVKGIKDQHTLYVFTQRKKKIEKQGEIDRKKLNECIKKFGYLKHSKEQGLKLIQDIFKDGYMENLLSKFPKLKDNREAQIVLKDYFMIRSYVEKAAKGLDRSRIKDHPIIVEALEEVFRDLTLPRDSGQSSSSSLPEMLIPFEDSSPILQPSPIITAQMLQDAMAEVMRNMGARRNTGGQNRRTPSVSSGGSSSANLHQMVQPAANQVYARQINMLMQYGFTDAEENARVLEETGGNVQQAVELLYAIRESMIDMEGTDE